MYSWYYLFLIKVLCFTIYYLFYFISFIANMDSSSKSFGCYLLFCLCCYYPYMLRLNLINYFASVRYCNSWIRVVQLECLTRKFCTKSPENLGRSSFHSWRIEQLRISIPRAHIDTLAYFYVQYPKRMFFRFIPTYLLNLTKLL